MKIIYTKIFKKSILKLDKNTQIRIVEKIDIFNSISWHIYDLNLDIKKIQPKEKGVYRLRVWKYRILFFYKDEIIKLLDVDNRDSIYL